MFITSSTGNLQAILTREGRQLLSDNSAIFQIVGFAFSDDEVDYSLFDGSSSDAPNTDILNLPILEPTSNTNGNAAQRYELLTYNYGTLNISKLELTNLAEEQLYTIDNLSKPKTVEIKIKSIRGKDSRYYLNSSNTNVISVDSEYVDTENDTDISQILQKQSVATTSFKINGIGNTILTIIGSDTKSIFKSNIIVRQKQELTTIPVNPPIIQVPETPTNRPLIETIL